MSGTNLPGRLRGALARADGPDVVAALSGQNWGDVLQFAGDALLMALAQHVERAPELARRCAEALRERFWEGDDDLAERLEATLGLGPVPLLRPLRIDLEELAAILEGDPVHSGGRIDLLTGELWPQVAIDYARETGEEDADDEDSDRWLAVSSEGSREGYRDMEDFISTVADVNRANRLSSAVSRPRPFRRFMDALSDWPGELQRWHTFSDERQRGRARAWLAQAGYTPDPRGSSLSDR